MKRFILVTVASGVMLALSPMVAQADTPALINLQTYSGVNPIVTSCATCHTSAPALNAFGLEYLTLGGTKAAGYVLALSAQNTLLITGDTDNDGIKNLAELQAGTNPAGDAASAPPGQASVTGCVSSALSTPLMMVFAMLSLGFFVRRKKDKS